MSVPASPKVVQIFFRVLAARGWIAAAFLMLAAAGHLWRRCTIPDDPAIERLIVAGDPVARATAEFDRLFPEGEQALIMLEAPDPLSPAALGSADQLEHELAQDSTGRGAQPAGPVSARGVRRRKFNAAEAEHMRAFATGTPLFRRAGLLGEHYFGIALELRVNSPAERNRALTAIDALVLPLESPGGPLPRCAVSARPGSTPGWSGKPARRPRTSCRCSGFF